MLKCGLSTSYSQARPLRVRPWTEAYVIALQSRVCFSSSCPAKHCPLSRRTRSPSTASTVRKVPFCTLPPAPINRSPGQTLMVCGAFVGTAPRASYGTNTASVGASRRFSRSLICNRFAWEMTRLTSGSPRLGKRRRASCTAAGNGTCSGSSTLNQVRNSKIRSSKRQRSESSWHQPPARSCSSWLSFSSLQTSAPAKLSARRAAA